MALSAVFIGDPVMDLVVRVDESFLEDNRLQAGGCLSLGDDELRRLSAAAEQAGQIPRTVAGGSAANSAKTLAALSDKTEVSFVGMIGPDQQGRAYRDGLESSAVRPRLVQSPTASSTAVCLCLVSGDGERTMRTCLSAAAELRDTDQLPAGWDSGSSLVHLEGYSLYRPQLAEAALSAARQHAATTSLDLASFELVQHRHDALQRLLQQQLIDLVFCNLAEARALVQARQLTQDITDDEAVIQAVSIYLLQHVQVCVVSLGSQGSLAFSRQGECAMARPPTVHVADTVGAGDCHTAGFLHAHLAGAPLAACLQCACAAGSAIVQCEGAELSAKHAQSLREHVQQILASHRQEL